MGFALLAGMLIVVTPKVNASTVPVKKHFGQKKMWNYFSTMEVSFQ
jgi:hypothetical protein